MEDTALIFRKGNIHNAKYHIFIHFILYIKVAQNASKKTAFRKESCQNQLMAVVEDLGEIALHNAILMLKAER